MESEVSSDSLANRTAGAREQFEDERRLPIEISSIAKTVHHDHIFHRKLGWLQVVNSNHARTNVSSEPALNEGIHTTTYGMANVGVDVAHSCDAAGEASILDTVHAHNVSPRQVLGLPHFGLAAGRIGVVVLAQEAQGAGRW